MNNFAFIFLMITASISAHAQSWQVLDTGTTSAIYDMSFPDGQSKIGYAATGSGFYTGVGTIIKTTDGGDTWTQVYPRSGTTDIFYSVSFTSVDTGFAGGMNDALLKTTDGGITWTNIPISSAGDIFYTIDFFDANNGIAVANPVATASSKLYITADAGVSWTMAPGPGHAVYDLTYSSADTVFAVGAQNQSISRSTDGGLSWNLVNTGSFTFILLGVDFVDNYGVAVGQFGDIYITNNGGNSWTYNTSISTSDNYEGIHVINSDTTYFGGMNEKMYKTTDGGLTWNVEYDGPGDSHFFDIEFTENGTGFASLSDGRILRKSPHAVLVLDITPANVDFGNVVVGKQETEKVVVYNRGNDTLRVSQIVTPSNIFSVDTSSFTVAPADSQVVRVMFAPEQPINYTDSLGIYSNDPTIEKLTVLVSGSGFVPTGIENENTPPRELKLHHNYPNPFNPETIVAFDLPTAQRVVIKIFDLSGREIKTLARGNFPAGRHRVSWNGRDSVGRQAASGMYLYRIVAGKFTQTRKMSLLR